MAVPDQHGRVVRLIIPNPSCGFVRFEGAFIVYQNQVIGRSRGGLTTKILALVDALGNFVRFTLWPGQRHDSVGVEPILQGIDFSALLAAKAFDSDALRLNLDQRGDLAGIPPKAARTHQTRYDLVIYRWRLG
jgi:hypothetical protein